MSMRIVQNENALAKHSIGNQFIVHLIASCRVTDEMWQTTRATLVLQ
jgi:hypothetical protein